MHTHTHGPETPAQTEGRLIRWASFYADMMRPSSSSLERFFTSLVLHHSHGIQFGIEDLPELLKEAGFDEIKQLDDHFLKIGFVRATKPAA